MNYGMLSSLLWVALCHIPIIHPQGPLFRFWIFMPILYDLNKTWPTFWHYLTILIILKMFDIFWHLFFTALRIVKKVDHFQFFVVDSFDNFDKLWFLFLQFWLFWQLKTIFADAGVKWKNILVEVQRLHGTAWNQYHSTIIRWQYDDYHHCRLLQQHLQRRLPMGRFVESMEDLLTILKILKMFDIFWHFFYSLQMTIWW